MMEKTEYTKLIEVYGVDGEIIYVPKEEKEGALKKYSIHSYKHE